jgi:hypothetical protein
MRISGRQSLPGSISSISTPSSASHGDAAWRNLTKNSNEVVLYKVLPFALEAVKQVALSRLKLFNNP